MNTGSTKVTAALNLSITDIPIAIRNAFQRVRIKKIEGIFKLSNPSELGTVQIAVCRSLAGDAAVDPLNVPGSQIKLLDLTSSTGMQQQQQYILRTTTGGFLPDKYVYVSGQFRDILNPRNTTRYQYINEVVTEHPNVTAPAGEFYYLEPTTPLPTTGSADLDIIKVSRFMPPVIIDSAVSTTKSNWIESNSTSGNWQIFNIGVYRDALQPMQTGTCHLDAYYTVTLHCDGQKA